MRMFSGFGTPEDTNARFRYLLHHGESGLSIAFDDPTLYGIDADDPESLGEVGKCGVNVSSLEDMRRLFRRIPMGKVTTSMTINAPANIIWGMYILTAEGQGLSPDKLGGTTQNDILKEYTAQKEFLYPPRPALRLVIDTIEYATRSMPNWNPVSVSGYHIREAGSTAVQELAFTLADGMAYVEETIKRGSRWTTSPPGSPSSSIPTTISSRRSRSSGPRVGSGRGSCAIGSVRRRSGRCGCGSTRRPRDARAPRSNPS